MEPWDWTSRIVIGTSVLVVVLALVALWLGPIPRMATHILLGVLPLLWIYDLVRDRRR